MSADFAIRRPLTEHARELDRLEFERIAGSHKSAVKYEFPTPAALPAAVDLSPHLRYIRDQNGAGGCFLYSFLAVWDIMNDIACPYSPTLSSRIWLLFHTRCRPRQPDEDHPAPWVDYDPLRKWWVNEQNGKFTCQDGIFTPDGRFHPLGIGPHDEAIPEWGFFQSFGNTTEGTELSAREYPVDWPIGPEDQPWLWNSLWTLEGIDEASNYRLDLTKDPQTGNMVPRPLPIDISSQSFANALTQNKPIRIGLSTTSSAGHVMAVVGYDTVAGTFKYVNSWGENWGDGGFGVFSYTDIDNKEIGPDKAFASWRLDSAETLEILPPSPVPAARIAFTHTNRSNVHLWLFAENSPLPRNKIWPQSWNENSRNLHYTVRLPSEFAWPPSANNRLVLELYDSAEYTTDGGQLVEFTAAFGDHIIQCSKLSAGPIAFQPRDRLQFVIP